MSIVYPQYCPGCGEDWTLGTGFVCDKCWRNLPLNRTGKWHLDSELKSKVLVGYAYKDIVHNLVHRMKFYGRSDIAEKFGMMTAYRFRKILREYNPHAVVPVPLHPVRIRERGFDQNATIGSAIARILDVPLKTDLIHRSRNTKPQSRLSDKNRLNNLKKAIIPVQSDVIYSEYRVLLVDDVIHTGTTLKSCMTTLAEIGIGDVIALAVCG